MGRFWERGAAEVASVKRHQELSSCWTVSDRSKMSFFISHHVLRFSEQGAGHLEVPGEY